MIDSPSEKEHETSTQRLLAGALVIAALALLMGLPALKGEFVGGDDHRLVLNHVLVNQPSFKHAVQLFTIVHRDLYQPLPLLTFQIEFVVAEALGLFDKSVEAGAWLFHLDNMWLHALNALLVGALLLKLQRHDRARAGEPVGADPLIPRGVGAATAACGIAFIAAVFFAIHPLQVEVVAWINGRMMLLSTLFLLLSLLSFARWLDNGRAGIAALCLLFVFLSAISKIRVGLPILLILVPLARGHKMGKRFWMILVPSTLFVAFFTAINIWSTSEAALFAGGEERLKGPRLARVLLALDFYLEHLVWPAGLASYYPTPTNVTWADPGTIRAIAVVGSVLVFLGALSLKSPAVRLGAVWFLAAIADTLPFIPARNILAADRYMYLPIIGLLWAIATILYSLYARLRIRAAGRARATATICGLLVIPVLIGVCWRVAKGYTTALAKTSRTAELFPNEPRVWELLAWVYNRAGQYDKAIDAGQRELVHALPDVCSGAYEVIGMSYFEKGDRQQGIEFLMKAIEADPRSGSAKYRLGAAYDDLGELDKAIPLLEQAAALSPRNDPVLRRLAGVYRKLDQLDKASERYAQVLENNPYDVEAVIGLVELDIDAASDGALEAAEQRLVRALGDVQSDQRLHQNLGMVRLLRNQANDSLRRAAAAFVALTDGRFALAARRVDDLVEQGQPASEARAWLLRSLERFDQERPGVGWTYGLAARLLIADRQTEAGEAFLGLFRRTCDSEACRDYAERIETALGALRHGA